MEHWHSVELIILLNLNMEEITNFKEFNLSFKKALRHKYTDKTLKRNSDNKVLELG